MHNNIIYHNDSSSCINRLYFLRINCIIIIKFVPPINIMMINNACMMLEFTMSACACRDMNPPVDIVVNDVHIASNTGIPE